MSDAAPYLSPPNVQSQLANFFDGFVMFDRKAAIRQFGVRHFLFFYMLLIKIPERNHFYISLSYFF